MCEKASLALGFVLLDGGLDHELGEANWLSACFRHCLCIGHAGYILFNFQRNILTRKQNQHYFIWKLLWLKTKYRWNNFLFALFCPESKKNRA